MDDVNLESMDKQVNLALQYGLDFFVFDTYIGTKKGSKIKELTEPLDDAFLTLEGSKQLNFGLMFALGSPRVVLPVPRVADFKEPNRDYDTNKLTATTIIDECIKNYWERENYLHLNGNPYVSVYTSNLGTSLSSPETQSFKEFIDFMHEYARQKYRIDPYIVGVIKKEEDGALMEYAGVNALTGYAYLPDFDTSAPAIQIYDALLQKREGEWKKIANNSSVPFVPPAVVGWDGSARGEQGFQLEEVTGYYPYTPIIEGSTPESFQRMLTDSINHTKAHVPETEQYGLVCAWNEVSEGCSLLPRIERDTINFDYLEALRNVTK